MKHRRIGKSDLEVSTVGLGCNNFGFVAAMDVEASRKVIDKAIDAGVHFFDTSDSYGTSENILGEVLGARRKKIVLATKFGAKVNALGEKSGNSRGYILAEVEESLHRPAHRLDRSLPDPLSRPEDADGRDAARA